MAWPGGLGRASQQPLLPSPRCPGAPLQVWSGYVPGEAGLGSPVAPCLGKHACSPGGLSAPLGLLAAVTPAHCSSSGSSGSLAPHPCPQKPPQSLGGFVHAEQVLRLAADTPVSTTESGCSTSPFSVWGTSLQAGTNAAFCEKAMVLTKILNSFLPSESFFFFF